MTRDAQTLHWLEQPDPLRPKAHRWLLAGYGRSGVAVVGRTDAYRARAKGPTYLASVADFGCSTWAVFASPVRARRWVERKLAARFEFDGWRIAPREETNA